MFDRKAYYLRTKQRQLDAAKAWRQANPKKFKAQKKRSRQNQLRTNYIGVLLSQVKARAKKKGIPFSITKDDIVIPTHCPILGMPLIQTNTELHKDDSPSVDRIIPSLGYIPSNVRIISWRANRIKCDATPDELRKIADFYM